MAYVFRKARRGEAEVVYAMIADRVRWMDEKGIRQWNVTDYLNVYPLEYYQENLDRLYVLTDKENVQAGMDDAQVGTECVLAASILLDQDDRWKTNESALYIHNFVSSIADSGAGKRFLAEVERYAAEQGKRFLRLDSDVTNKKLADYYEALGFTACGTCQDGPYRGVLREKEVIKNPNQFLTEQ